MGVWVYTVRQAPGHKTLSQPPSGSPAPTSHHLAETTTTPTVTIGGASANVLFSGLAPGFVGEYEVTVWYLRQRLLEVRGTRQDGSGPSVLPPCFKKVL
jgi:hypothetical protein